MRRPPTIRAAPPAQGSAGQPRLPAGGAPTSRPPRSPPSPPPRGRTHPASPDGPTRENEHPRRDYTRPARESSDHAATRRPLSAGGSGAPIMGGQRPRARGG